MNITPVENTNNNISYKGIKVLGNAPDKIKTMIYDSKLNNYETDLIAVTSTKKADAFDYNHSAGTVLYKFKIMKAPQNIIQKWLMKLGVLPGEYLSPHYHSEVGLNSILKSNRVSKILNKLK